MDNIVTISIVVIGIIITLVLIYLAYQKYVDNKYRHMVKIASKRYRYLQKVYQDMRIGDLNLQSGFYISCNSLAQLRNINYDKKLDQYLKDHKDQYISYINIKDCLEEYELIVKDAPGYLSEDMIVKGFAPEKVNATKFHNIETMMCKFYENVSINSFGFSIKAEYVSPAGRNEYHDGYRYSIDEIISKYDTLSKTKEKRRRTVSLSQRQRILRRDGFVCQLCGAKGPGAGGDAVLHVDHKIPFSKGGSDDDSNLWTLCQECNQGKSDKYID